MYQLTTAVSCIVVPVFPDVGSITVSPGFRIPSFSASSIILIPILSLTEPPELKNSHLATKVENTRYHSLYCDTHSK